MNAPNHTDEINRLSVKEIADRISHWIDFNKTPADFEQLTAAVWRLCNKLPFETLRVESPTAKFFRARKADGREFFSRICDLWYPPPHCLRTLGRANKLGSPMLYVSQDGRTALFELRPQVNESIVVTEIGLREGQSLNLQHVGVLHTLASGNLMEIATSQRTRLTAQGYTEHGINNISVVHRLLGEEFLRDVAPGNENEYAVSVAIADFFLSYRNADGLIFPSKRSPNDYNIVIKPESADLKLCVKRIYDLEVASASATDIEFRYWNASREVRQDGSIEWHPGSILPELEWNSSGSAGVETGSGIKHISKTEVHRWMIR